MPHKQKAAAEEKTRVVRECLAGRMGKNEAAHLLRVNGATIRRWIHQYEAEGPSAFLPHERNRVYTPELNPYYSCPQTLRPLIQHKS